MKTQTPQGRLAHFLAHARALRPKKTRKRFGIALFLKQFGSYVRNTSHVQRRQSRAPGRPCVRRRSAHRARRRSTRSTALGATDPPPPGTELGLGGRGGVGSADKQAPGPLGRLEPHADRARAWGAL